MISAQESKTKLKMTIGWLLAKAMPKKAAKIKQSFTLPYWGRAKSNNIIANKAELLIRFYLAYNDNAVSGGEELEEIHKEFWRNQLDTQWFDTTADTFESTRLPVLLPIVKKIADISAQNSIETVCEIGTGDGKLIAHLKEALPHASRFIGIDLSAERMEFNSKHYSGIEFIGGDAFEWIKTQGCNNTLYVTDGGVMEYFSQKSLESMLDYLVQQQDQSLLAFLYEPMADDHDLAKSLSSRLTKTGEFSFSHNYPYLLTKAGFDINYQQEDELLGYRAMTIIASIKKC